MKTVFMILVFFNPMGEPLAIEATDVATCKAAAAAYNEGNIEAGVNTLAFCSETLDLSEESLNSMLRNRL